MKVRVGHQGIFSHYVHGLQTAHTCRLHHLHYGQPRRDREFFPPCPFELPSCPRIRYFLIATVNIRQGPHIAGPLHIVLPPQRVNPGHRQADMPGEHDQVGTGPYIVHPGYMLCNPHCVKEHRALLHCIYPCNTPYVIGLDPGNPLNSCW
ncbi:hypothetical protein BMS3Bbin07_00804 [bacterium BMS3Bbin07]|nr:hypothetical protein BMS3Bbin07_00804 [bacterium BMS3Bbin07]